MKISQHIIIYIILISIAMYSGYVSIIKNTELATQNKVLQSQLQQAQYNVIKYKQMYIRATNKLVVKQHYPSNKLIQWVIKHSTRCSNKLAHDIVSWCDDKPMCLILLAVIARESSFNPTATSKTGAIGLGQIMPLWIPELVKNKMLDTKRDLYNPLINISCTEYILKKYLQQTNGDLATALAKYMGANNKHYIHDVLCNIGELAVTLNKY